MYNAGALGAPDRALGAKLSHGGGAAALRGAGARRGLLSSSLGVGCLHGSDAEAKSKGKGKGKQRAAVEEHSLKPKAVSAHARRS